VKVNTHGLIALGTQAHPYEQVIQQQQHRPANLLGPNNQVQPCGGEREGQEQQEMGLLLGPQIKSVVDSSSPHNNGPSSSHIPPSEDSTAEHI